MHAETEPVITTEEAQAVFELWARRKQELEALRQLPTAADLAEAMGISTAEVQTLLSEVRRTRVVTPPPVLPHRRRRRVLAGVIVIAGVLSLALSIGYLMGIGSAPRQWSPAFTSTYGLPPSQRLPDGLKAEYRGYTLVGEDKGRWDHAASEARILSSLRSVVERMSPRPLYGGTGETVDEAAMIQALRGNVVPESLQRVLAFEPITLSLAGKSTKVFIPIALTSDFPVNSLVEAERDRRLQVAANKAAQLVAEAQAAQPSGSTATH